MFCFEKYFPRYDILVLSKLPTEVPGRETALGEFIESLENQKSNLNLFLLAIADRCGSLGIG